MFDVRIPEDRLLDLIVEDQLTFKTIANDVNPRSKELLSV